MNLIEGISFDDIQTRNEKILEEVNHLNSIEHERLGMEKESKFGSNMKIVGYRNCDSIDVLLSRQIGDVIAYDLKRDTKFSHFKNGNIKSNYDTTLCDYAYNGIGFYNKKDMFDGFDGSLVYNYYNHMIRLAQKNNSIIDNSFLDYQNFFEWFKSQFYQVSNGETMCLDKNILYKNNNIYSPTTCVFVPISISKLLMKQNKLDLLPTGVSIEKNGSFRAQCSVDNSLVQLGIYNTLEEAFNKYKEFKENNIKRVANYYWNELGCSTIPQFNIIYHTLMNYKVEITD